MDYSSMSIEDLADYLALYSLTNAGFADDAADDADADILAAWGF